MSKYYLLFAGKILYSIKAMDDKKISTKPEEVTPQEGATLAKDPIDGTQEDIAENPPKYATPNATTTLLNLESLINGYIADLENFQEKMKTQREMFNDAFMNDAEYSQIMQKVKEVNRLKAAAKQKIMKLPNVVEIFNKMREYKDEMKDIQEGLSTYLQQYQELSGSNQITSDNGEVRQIVSVTKLVKVRT